LLKDGEPKEIASLHVLRYFLAMERNIELDHIFLFVTDEEQARSMMRKAGLRINYSRKHPGQGTQNVCACLDDMFIELLWFDGSTIAAECNRVSLTARGLGRGLPVGIAWRGDCDLQCIDYAAPFLPAGITIPIAEASLDLDLPFVFRTPGGKRPIDRSDGLVGDRQAPRLTTLESCTISVPNPEPVHRLLKNFDRIVVTQGNVGARFRLLAPDGSIGRDFTWYVN
jgi:hypothetical protein